MLTQPKLAIAIAIAICLLSTTIGFSQQPAATSDRVFPASSASRTTDSVAPNSSGVIRVSSAKLICLHKIQIAAQSDGLIEKLLADEGQLVSKGDTLLNIDARIATAELEVAKKELEAAQKQAAQTAEVEYSKKASAVADEEYKAEWQLLQDGSSTLSQAQRKRLEAERSRLGIEVAEVKHQTEMLAAEVAAAKLDAARAKLDLYNVIAPYDGVIYERVRDEGEWIRAGEPVLRLIHMNEMKVEALVPITGISLVDLQNAPMTVFVQISPQRTIEIPTSVEFVSPEVLSNRVRVTAKVQNQKVGEMWVLGDGMTASLDIQLPVQ